MRTGSTLAELLVVLSIVGLAGVMFVPRGDADVTAYTLDIIIGVVAVGAILVCVVADWKPKRVAGGLLFYFLIWPPICLLILAPFYPRVLQCAGTLLH